MTNRPSASRIGLVVLFSATGLLHFVVPAFFDRIVPPWIPNARLATLVSGACELAGALGLLVPRVRIASAVGLIALLVAVFPANVYMLQQAYASESSGWWRAALWARLPMQPLLIWLVWRSGVRDR
jgi:uncharacterized membrane protein